jgi:uncharacterized membrane protein (DUF4010 family)
VERTVLIQLLISLALGLLVGFQREWADKRVAGVRTYPLLTAFGTISVLIADRFGGWIVAVALLAVAGFLMIGNVQEFRKGNSDTGITSEISALVMFGVGCAIGLEWYRIGVLVTGAVAVLLHWKAPIHGFVKRVGAPDLNAIFRVVLVAMVILPVLPDRSYGPYDVINPFEIWTMVTLIVGISLGAYVAYKLLGERTGTIVTGLLGGLISSTATTLSYARSARSNPGSAGSAAVVILIASAVVMVRVLFEISVMAPSFLRDAWIPLGIFLAIVGLVAAAAVALLLSAPAGAVGVEAPADIKSALIFGGLYAAVLLGVAFAREHLGNTGLYAVAALSGLTDMDAITLSSAQLVNAGTLDASHAWRMIVLGAIANLGFKGVAVAMLGTRQLLVRVAVGFGVSAVAGGALILFWP